MKWVGVLLSLTAGVINGVGFTLQKGALNECSTSTYLTNYKWWIGIGCIVTAELIGGTSFLLLPASVVVALGSTAVVFSAIFSYFFNRETLDSILVIGTISVVTGAVILGIITPASAQIDSTQDLERILSSWTSVVYQTFVVVISIVMMFLLKKISIVTLAFYAAAVSSLTIVWIRPLLLSILLQEHSYLPYVSAAIVGSTAIWAAFVLEPLGLTRYMQTQWVPVHFVACILLFGLAGELVYGDLQNVRWNTFATALPAILLVLWGVFLLTSKR